MIQWVGVSASEQWVPRGWAPRGCWQLRTWPWGHSPPTLPRPLGGLLPAPASSREVLQKGRARRCSGFSSPRSLAADPCAQTPTSPSAASACGAVPNYSLSVNGASLCVCSAPVPTVMVVVIVLLLQGVCFSNTTVLEPCLLWFRRRNSQPCVHISPSRAMGRSRRAVGFCPSAAEERGWGHGVCRAASAPGSLRLTAAEWERGIKCRQ